MNGELNFILYLGVFVFIVGCFLLLNEWWWMVVWDRVGVRKCCCVGLVVVGWLIRFGLGIWLNVVCDYGVDIVLDILGVVWGYNFIDW